MRSTEAVRIRTIFTIRGRIREVDIGANPIERTTVQRDAGGRALHGDPRRAVRQVLEADMVYVRDFTDPKSMTGEQWKQLALIAHHCYGSIDLAVRAITAASEIGACPASAVDQYMTLAIGR